MDNRGQIELFCTAYGATDAAKAGFRVWSRTGVGLGATGRRMGENGRKWRGERLSGAIWPDVTFGRPSTPAPPLLDMNSLAPTFLPLFPFFFPFSVGNLESLNRIR